MARPRTPLISRQAAVAAALEIIDTEGLEAFSLPRLARHMGVRAPSLYHHFRDKAAILAAVSRTIVAESKMPRQPPPEQWQDWFVNLSLALRTAVLRHRNAAPLLLQFLPREEMTRLYDVAARYLDACGIPARLHVQILDGLETISLASTLIEATGPPAKRQAIFPDVDRDKMPILAAALDANTKTRRQLFEAMIRSFLTGVLELDAAREEAAATEDTGRAVGGNGQAPTAAARSGRA